MKKTYSVVRIQNVERTRGLDGVLAHCLRKNPKPDHLRQGGTFKVLLGSPNLRQALTDATAAVPAKTPTGRKVRTDAVEFVQVLLRVDPLCLGGSGNPSAWTQERKQVFEEASLKWLEEHCPGQVLHAVAHYDEESPHIHALAVPIVPGKDGQPGLSRVAAFGGKRLQEARQKLSSFQTSFAAVCTEVGLQVQRGANRVESGERAPDYSKSIDVRKRRRGAARTQQLEERVESLQGQVEDLAAKNAQLRARAKALLTEVSERLGQTEESLDLERNLRMQMGKRCLRAEQRNKESQEQMDSVRKLEEIARLAAQRTAARRSALSRAQATDNHRWWQLLQKWKQRKALIAERQQQLADYHAAVKEEKTAARQLRGGVRKFKTLQATWREQEHKDQEAASPAPDNRLGVSSEISLSNTKSASTRNSVQRKAPNGKPPEELKIAFPMDNM